MDRVCIFIDGSNFYHALKGASLPVRVDLGKLGAKLTGPDRHHIHTYYYNTPLIHTSWDKPTHTPGCGLPRRPSSEPQA